MALPTSQRERGVIVAARGDVDLGPVLQQELGGIEMALPDNGTEHTVHRAEPTVKTTCPK